MTDQADRREEKPAIGGRLLEESILPRYKQAEIESGHDDQYLATSLGLNWVYHPEKDFTREKTKDIPEDAIARENL